MGHLLGGARRSPALPLALTLIALGVFSADADAAGTVTHNGGTGGVSTIRDGAGQVSVFVTLTDCEIGGEPATCDEFFTSDGALAPRGNCFSTGGGDVACPQADSYVASLGGGADSLNWDDPLYYNSFTADGGSGDDSIYGADRRVAGFPLTTVIRGGPGRDTLYGGPGRDSLDGGTGNSDQLHGFAGNDRLLGGAGNEFDLEGGPGRDRLDFGPGGDILDAGEDPGGDTYIGGRGRDRLFYGFIRNGVKISLDRRANDGSRGERDNVGSDIEEVVGSDGRDVLVGNRGANHLEGASGNDKISGGGGNDVLIGDDDDDIVIGGGGRDSLYGDEATCGSSCATGNDTIKAVDRQRDLVSCGPGVDNLLADRIDVAASDPLNRCERVRRS